MEATLRKNKRDLMRPFRNFWQRFTRRFADGSLGTKLSYFIFGAGNLYHKQIIKGLIFLILQIAIILFMVLCPTINGTAYGYKALLNLPMHNLSEGAHQYAVIFQACQERCND